MKLSIKHSPIGKPAKTIGREHTYHWIAVDLTPQQLVDHICKGKPFAVGQYRHGHRSKKNFLVSGIIALDYDQIDGAPISDSQFSQIVNDEFIQKNAFAVIQSFSSAENARRFRVLFRLSEDVTDPDLYSELVKIVIEKAPYGADKAPSDAGRAFYGTKPGSRPDFETEGGK